MRFNERLHFFDILFGILHGMSSVLNATQFSSRGGGRRNTSIVAHTDKARRKKGIKDSNTIHRWFGVNVFLFGERLSTTSYVGIVQQIVGIILKLPKNGSF